MSKIIRIVSILLVVAVLTCLFWYFMIFRTDISSSLYVSLGNTFLSHNRPETAASLYSRAADLCPDDSELLVRTSNAYLAIPNYTKAEYYLQAAIVADPDNVDLYLALSKVFIVQDKLLDAGNMIDQCASSSVKTTLESLRPAIPVIEPPGDFYWEEVDCTLSYSDGIAYYSTDGEYPSVSKNAYDSGIHIGKGISEIQAVVVGSNGLVSALADESFTICGEIRDVTFEDSEIDMEVRSLLGKSIQDKISTTDLWQITSLTVSESVNDISFLEDFIGLKELKISGSHESFATIASLRLLESLDLSGVALSDDMVSVISQISTLKYLNLSGCSIQSAEFLSSLTQLQILDLSDNQISDISPLSSLSNLTELNLENNIITTIAPLTALNNMEVLTVSNNQIESLGALAANTSLTELAASNCGISDISPLENKSLLSTLDLSSNQIYTISSLASCLSLETVDLSHNNIASGQPLSSLKSLFTLDISYNNLTSCPDFKDSLVIVKLYMNNNQIQDVSSLAKLQHLSLLNISDNRIEDIDVLADCISLVRVEAYNNPISNVDALEEKSIIAYYTPGYSLSSVESEE